jgi:hypothetical protein
MIVALLIGLIALALHCVGVVRLKDVLSGDMKARGPISGLIGSVGVLILGLALLAYWCTIGLYVFMFIFGTGGGEASGIPLGFALIAFPFVHGFAELLVYLGFDDW